MCIMPSAPKPTTPAAAPEVDEPVLQSASENTDRQKRNSAALGTDSLRIQRDPTASTLPRKSGLQLGA